MNIKKIMSVGFAVAVEMCALASSPTISNVTAKQRYPWNGLVDITFTVVGDVAAGLPSWNRPLLSLSAMDYATGSNYIARASALSGDTGTEIGTHHVVWNLNEQKFKSDNVVFKVAYETIPKYCIIDLSGGVSATNYTVTYMDSPPSGGFNVDTYKTTHLVLRLIAPGSFKMLNVYDATLTKPYYMGVFEVTQKQYELVTGWNPSGYKGGMRPVEYVSWGDSSGFVGKIQVRTDLAFDLPTEAQWEYACRAGTTNSYNNGGSTIDDLKKLGRYDGNQSDGKGGYTTAHTTVGSYLPNAWGLYDMHGNVWEWCLNWYVDHPYGGTDPMGPTSYQSVYGRVLRGGSWYTTDAARCGSSSRGDNDPRVTKSYNGFRIARTLSAMEGSCSPYAVARVGPTDELCAGYSVPVAVDLRVEPVVTDLDVSWNAAWIGGNANAMVVISDNGTQVKSTTGMGVLSYTLSGIGRHDLTYTTYINGWAQNERYKNTVYAQWKYEVDNGGAIITETTQTSGTITIPSVIDGCPVISIGDGTFSGCNGLTSVIIPDGITSIGIEAFMNCVGLTSVTVPKSVTQIGERAFAGCTALTLIILPSRLDGNLSENVFDGCSVGLRKKYADFEVYFNANGGNVEEQARWLAEGAAVGTLPTPTRTGYTFAGWWTSASGGTQITTSTIVTGNVTYYAQWQINQYTVTFNANGGTGGKSVTQNYGTALSAPTVTREWCNFNGWSPAVPSTVPANNVTYTAQWARWGDTISSSKMGGKTMKQLYPSDYAYMTTMVLEEGITELPTGFFDGCGNVEFVTWPSTLVEFGIDDLPTKIRATLAYDANGFMIYNGWILDYQNRNASAVTIPEGIVGIGRGVFAAMYDLETVTMPESLRCIARGAFEDCSWLLNLQFMSGLRYVGPVAFRGCSSLLGASFADGVEILGTNVFENCWQMQSVRLPYTVTNIGFKAFTGCSAIRGVTVPTHLKTMQNLFPASYSQIETAEVAEGETTVMDDMFAGCVALRGGATQTDMSMIPNTVTNIGARAFQNCTSLTAFVVPDSVVEMGAYVFSGCTALWNVTLSRSLSAIPDYAFYGCSMLETMVVPESVTYLGNRFFSGRTNPTPGIVIENALYYLCTNAPAYHADAYAAIAGNMTTYVLQGSRSWDGRQGSRVLPQTWNGYAITYWTPNRFDVTFDANGGRFDSSGGSTWSEQQITDTTYALPSTEPTRPGWAFEGWWTEQTGGAEVRYTTVVTATRTHTLYAHWRSLGEGMTVSFNSNGGTVVTPGTQNYVPGQTFGQFPVPTRRGYKFQGWWTEAVNGIRMTEATEVPAADMELFAHWTPITYYVRFNPNGGVGEPFYQSFTFDVQQALATHKFTRTGFAFSGWATTPSGQVRYPENKSVVNLEEVQDEVVDLYAVWSGVGYSVRFDSNGGTGIMDNQTIAVGETQNLWPCAFARGGYTFAGWAVSPSDAEAKKVTYLDGQAVKDLATSNGAVVPLYAVWVAEGQTVRITFDANGGSVSPNDYWDCVVGTAVEAFPTPTRPGFTFAGWWTAPSGGTRVTSIPRVTASQTFYAHWTENGGVEPGDGSCTVTFNANGGSVSPTKRTLDSGSAVGNLPTPVRTGYEFAGWWTAANGGVEVYATTRVSSSVTYYAHWSEIKYTVTFVANGGTGMMYGQTMTYDAPARLSAVGFSKADAYFRGWATSADGKVVYEDQANVMNLTTVANDVVTLYAVWRKKSAATPWPNDGEYDPLVANVYEGYILDGDGALAGIIQVKAAKQAVKTVTDRVTKVKTVTTNVAVTATVTDAAGKKWSYSKGDGTVDGVVTGLVCTTKGVLVPSFGVTLGANGLEGEWGDSVIAGARNGMGTKGDAMMAALDANYKKSWSVALTNDLGVTRLQLVVGAKGSTKISGSTPDGFKINATVQGIMGEDAFFVPCLATVKSGKLSRSVSLLLSLGQDGTVVARTSDLGGLKAAGPTTDAMEVLSYAESASSKGGETYAGAVVLNDLSYPAKFAAKGLPTGLKIDTATGEITGTPTKPGRYTATITVTSGVNSKVKIETKVDFDIGNYTDAAIDVEDSYSGYCVGVMVNEPIAAAVDCAVSGLPAGLKLAAKETKDATFGIVAAGTVYGVPTKAGEYTVYFKKTEKVNGKSVNHQASATFKVEALPAWAQGTFDGVVERGTGNGEWGTGNGEVAGLVTLTVGANGKISGKVIDADGTWTLTAAAFSSVERLLSDVQEPSSGSQMSEVLSPAFRATVTGKNGKKAITNEVMVTAEEMAGTRDACPYRGVASGWAASEPPVEWTAWQNLWKAEPWKTDAKPFAKAPTLAIDAGTRDACPYQGTVTLKFAASGAVTASGKFVTGKDAKGREVVYSASCSSVLVPAGAGRPPYRIFLYFPPKAGKFEGYSDEISLVWDGTTFKEE